MKQTRFSKSSVGKLITVGQGDTSYTAFVPNPLPPDFAINNMELIRTLSDADRALGELAGLGRTLPNPQLLIAPFIRREAILSSRIEGTQTGITELYSYEAGQLPLPGMNVRVPEADTREVLNYVHALEYGLERLQTLPVSKRLLCEIHKRLMQGVRGEHAYRGTFRTSQNWIDGATINVATFVPPPVPQMNEALNSLEAYMHQPHDYPPLLRLALIHYQFEAIHPFVDGNGRTGRLLVSLLLVHWGLIPQPLLYLSAFLERNKDEYYKLLLAVSESGAWQEWAIFFLRGIAKQSSDAIKLVKQLQDLQRDWHKRLTTIGANAKVVRLADKLLASPALTVSGAQRILDVVTPKSAQYNIEKLVELKILRPGTRGAQGRVYYANEILDILKQDER